jgi:quinoprotein glucose dehydrogenase
VTIGYRLVQLNAKTGQPISTFGKNGVVDLKDGVVYGKLINGKWQQVQIPLVEGEIGTNSTPSWSTTRSSSSRRWPRVCATNTRTTRKASCAPMTCAPASSCGASTRCPGPGEFGHDTWENGSWNWTGNTGVWTEMSADAEAGLVYLPVESGTIDAYGGNRPGAGLFARERGRGRSEDGQAEVALPGRPPRLWDYDLPGRRC